MLSQDVVGRGYGKNRKDTFHIREGTVYGNEKCKECGKEISTKAVSCPGCGAISKKKTGCFTWLVVDFFIIVMISVFKTSDYDVV